MSSTTGENIKISIWGQSHSQAIGVTIDGLPAGIKIDTEKLQSFLDRRAPGQSKYTTPRKEGDKVEFLSGLVNSTTCGAPLCATIKNTNTRSQDYNNIMDTPRPAHADYTAHIKYNGFNDVSGGGHFSGRLTAPLCIAGGICIQILEEMGIKINAHIKSIGKETDPEKQLDVIEKARMNCDSVGGIIECEATNVPVGWGDPMFGGLENKISGVVFGIPAIKGIEFGNGFLCADIFGSENNDEFYIDENGQIKTRTNNHGGILGGISSGMPIVFRVAVKPTPSISKTQNSISLSKNENTKLEINGRHDPCIAIRAVPCVEAACAIALYDAYLEDLKGSI